MAVGYRSGDIQSELGNETGIRGKAGKETIKIEKKDLGPGDIPYGVM